MQTLLFIKTQSFTPKPSSFFKPTNPKPQIPLQASIFTPSSHLSPLSNQTQVPKSIIIARKKRAANGSLKFTKILLRLMPILASNLKVVPPPLDQIVEAINGGDCGGGGFWKGLGGGGGFDGFGGRRKKRNGFYFLFYGVLVICGLGLLCYKDLERSNVVWFGLFLGGFGISLMNLMEKNGGLFGVFALGVLVGLGFNKELMLKIRPIMDSVGLRRGRKRTRRAF